MRSLADLTGVFATRSTGKCGSASRTPTLFSMRPTSWPPGAIMQRLQRLIRCDQERISAISLERSVFGVDASVLQQAGATVGWHANGSRTRRFSEQRCLLKGATSAHVLPKAVR